jgi:hypothetical protein
MQNPRAQELIVSRIENNKELVNNSRWKCTRCNLRIEAVPNDNDLQYLIVSYSSEQMYCKDSNILNILREKYSWIPPFQCCDKDNILVLADIGDPLSSLISANEEFNDLESLFAQYSSQLFDIHNLGIYHRGLSLYNLFFSKSYGLGTILMFLDSEFAIDCDKQASPEEDWWDLLEIFKKLDKKRVYQEQIKIAEEMLESEEFTSRKISDLFHRNQKFASDSYCDYEFLLSSHLRMPITDIGRLTEYILFFYIRRLFIINGYDIKLRDPKLVIGQTVKVSHGGLAKSKISSHVFGWNWLKKRLGELKIHNQAILEDSKWAWNDTTVIEMNFRSELVKAGVGEVEKEDTGYIRIEDFPFSNTLNIFQFVVDPEGSVTIEQISNFSSDFKAGMESAQAFVEFYAEDSSLASSSQKPAMKADSRILEKLFQLIKSVAVGMAEDFFANEKLSLTHNSSIAKYAGKSSNMSPQEFNELVQQKSLKWKSSVVGFAAVCVASEFFDLHDPASISRTAKMLQIFPEFLELVQAGKLFILHIPHNVRDILMAHKQVRISKNFDSGFIDFIRTETRDRKFLELEANVEKMGKEFNAKLGNIDAKLGNIEDEIRNGFKDLNTPSIVKAYRKVKCVFCSIYDLIVYIFVLLWSFLRK